MHAHSSKTDCENEKVKTSERASDAKNGEFANESEWIAIKLIGGEKKNNTKKKIIIIITEDFESAEPRDALGHVRMMIMITMLIYDDDDEDDVTCMILYIYINLAV